METQNELFKQRQVASTLSIGLVQHLPFLTGLAFARTSNRTAEALHSARLRKGSPFHSLVWNESVDSALEFQNYTPELREELSGYLPHRIASLRVRTTQEQLAFQPGACMSFDLTSAVCNFWNIGVGILSLHYRVFTNKATTFEQLRIAIDNLHTSALRRWSQTTEQCVDLLRQTAFPTYLRVLEEVAPPGTQPLWVHDIVLFEGNLSASNKAGFDSLAGFFTDGGSRYTLTMENRKWLLRLGVTACLITDDEACRQSTFRIVEAHQAIWTAAIDYDRRLFRALSRTTERSQPTLRHLENELNNLLHLQGTIGNFAAGLSNVPAHLARLDQQIWKAVCETWGLQGQLTALTEKLSALRDSYSEITSRINTQRSRRLSYFLMLFTLLTAVSAAASLRTFTQEDLKPLNPTNVQWLLIVAAAGLVVISVLAFFILRGYRRKSRQWPPSGARHH